MPASSLLRYLLPLASLCALGCGADQPVAAGAPDRASTAPVTVATETKTNSANTDLIAAQIADTLQACSYDGAPVRFGMGGRAPEDCRDMIAEVMNFTGLPQNFNVTEADVPNAAAAIMLDDKELPHRVIAFNLKFIDLVERRTGNPWAAVSIMAHEVGHHLAGHTIQPGGSQPPVELEADKFSGFVLYKMGAGLGDALKAIQTLVPETVAAGSSHPARADRIAAIEDGWNSACRQTGRGDCASGSAGSQASSTIAAQGAGATVAAARPAPASEPSMRDPMPQPPSEGVAPARVVESAAEILPTPDAQTIPSKGTRFIHDEFGMLNAAERARQEQLMFEHARNKGVEVVTLLVKDLHGLSAEDYAWAMLRQLRVGKLDVGNGAVLVVAPLQGQVGHAFGPGVAQQLESRNPDERLARWIDLQWKNYCQREQACNAFATQSLLSPARSVIDNTGDVDWTVRYPSYADLVATYRAETEATRGQAYDPDKDHTRRALARVDGTVVRINPADRENGARVNASLSGRGWLPVHLRTDAGENVMLYVDARTQTLMPGGALREGRRYSAITRVIGLSWNPEDTGSLYLLSYVDL